MGFLKDAASLMNPTRWAVLAGVLGALVLVVGASAMHIHGKGVAAGRAEIKAQWLEAENADLRAARLEASRLASITNNLNEVNREQNQTIDRLADDLRSRGVRITKAERDAAIAAGDAEAVRRYATTAADHFGACREEYVDLGRGYAKCSATAQSLNAYANEVSGRPSRPTAPTNPTAPSQP